MMKLYKNVASGLLFIGINEDIEDIGDEGSLLLITPEGKIKRLEEHLFESVDGSDSSEGARFVAQLTDAQRAKHQEVLGSLLRTE